jgi:hypothetical protein
MSFPVAMLETGRDVLIAVMPDGTAVGYRATPAADGVYQASSERLNVQAGRVTQLYLPPRTPDQYKPAP